VRLSASHEDEASPRAIDPVPAMNGGFEELVEARIHVPAGGPWTFWIDDEPVPVRDGAWIWTPGFFAGEVIAELTGPGGAIAARYLLDVSPHASKLGRERYLELIEEVLREDPALVAGFEPASLLFGAEAPVDDPLAAIVMFSRLRLHGPGFVSAVREAGRQPRAAMRTARAVVELHRARRIDVQSVRALARTPAVALLSGDPLDEAGDGAGGRVQVDVPVRELTLDCAANRCVVAILHLVRQRVRRVRDWLATTRARTDDGETVTSLAARAPHRIELLERLDADLWRLLREDPWRRVSRPEITAAGLNALAADPRYARVHQLGWKALRAGVGGPAREDRLGLSPTWELFERWCFVRLARLLRAQFPELVWTREPREALGRSFAAWVGRATGLTLSLLLQPVFPSWDRRPAPPFRSVSRERCPDLVIAAERNDDRRYVVLDAKYRQTRQNVLEAMESAHIYRDSLRWHGRRPELALLAVPAAPGAPWLSDDAFVTAERVGAFVLDESVPAPVLSALGFALG
jgi:uncharacterized protein DUF2357/PD-(D/E)XK nuclease superfamily protein